VAKKILFLILIFLVRSQAGHASHIYGGELLYKHVSGLQYKVILYLYGDCSGQSFPSLFVDATIPKVYVLDGNSLLDSIALNRDTIGVDISPVCPDQMGNTTCNGGTLPGVKKFVFSQVITLPAPSANWRFVFPGGMHASIAGRSNKITNIPAPGNTQIQLEAMLNNISGGNNSPIYTTKPTPYYCTNVEAQYNQGADDADGDSLAFRLVAAVKGVTYYPLMGMPVSYLFPATATAPILTDSGNFSFNQYNGQLTFTPNSVQDALVDYQVQEYKHGVLVGTSVREMTFIVTDQCQAAPPKAFISAVSGGSAASSSQINMCIGTPHLAFAIAFNNPTGEPANVIANNVPASASVTVAGNNTGAPVANFSWDTDSLPTGTYTTTQTLAYTINVVNQPVLAATQVSATHCINKAIVQLNISQGYLPRMVTITQAGSVVRGYTDTTGIIVDSFVAGDYLITAGSDPSCRTMVNFAIVDSGTLPLSPFNFSYCKNASLDTLQVQPVAPGAVITWFDTDNSATSTPPITNAAVPGTYTWYIQEQYKVCVSDMVTVTSVVHDLPNIDILSRPRTICYGDSIYLKASGGIAYTWTPDELVHTNALGEPYALVREPVTLYVKAVDQYGCFNNDSITYSDIQPCCNFTYPNAFTPNGDGRNDGFKVITYGNMWDYRLTIVNRWGQVVFLSVDPHEYWDGTQHGVPCESGVYFYYFTGRCLVGRSEQHKGDVTLVR
jgi:gliding motility-associated-like protein